jgi:hypothetical protein
MSAGRRGSAGHDLFVVSGWADLEMEGIGAAAPQQWVVLLPRAGDPELGRQVVRSLVVDLEVEEAWNGALEGRVSFQVV